MIFRIEDYIDMKVWPKCQKCRTTLSVHNGEHYLSCHRCRFPIGPF